MPQNSEKTYLVMSIEQEIQDATTIGNYAYAYNPMVSEAHFPEATKIGDSSFAGCSSLGIAEIPLAREIGQSAFSGCLKLHEADFPNAVSIGKGAFKNCESTTRVNFPNVSIVEDETFMGCSSLDSAVFGGLVEIGESAFSGCGSLKEFFHPETRIICELAFKGCGELKDALFPQVVSIGQNTFDGCVGLEAIELPNVEVVPDGLFGNGGLHGVLYVNLKHATQIPTNLFTALESSVARCINLGVHRYEYVNAMRESWGIDRAIDVVCLDGWVDTTKTEMNQYLEQSGEQTVDGVQLRKTSGLQDYVIGDDTLNDIDLYCPLVGIVDPDSFSGCQKVKKVYFPAARVVGDGAFNGCVNMTQLRFPSITDVEKIGENAFCCQNLKYIDLGGIDVELASTKLSFWGIPEGCAILCGNGTVVA